ncbi:MAG TPA: hypothetical protein VFL57_22615 [Bryobacteraceae bacterium]|nr:hypothetical protein [Bryobacteraceae bacterium]
MSPIRKFALTVGSFLALTVLVSALAIPTFREAERESQQHPISVRIAQQG